MSLSNQNWKYFGKQSLSLHIYTYIFLRPSNDDIAEHMNKHLRVVR